MISGREIFEMHAPSGKEPSEYGRLLWTIYLSIGDALFPLLEKAEKEGKRLSLTPEPTSYLRDELAVDDIIFV
jgi:hypothetical protein